MDLLPRDAQAGEEGDRLFILTGPAEVSVFTRTVSPDRIQSTGSLSIGNQPQARFSGVEGTK